MVPVKCMGHQFVSGNFLSETSVKMKKYSRRKFIGNTAKGLATAGFATILPVTSVKATSRRSAPSDLVNLGFIGLRNIGNANMNAHLHWPEANVVALCDVDENILRERSGELQQKTGKQAAQYTDFRKMLENPDIDAVVIGTPDHWHALMTIYACQAGKDVYVEKPLANSIEACQAMVQAVRRYNRICQVGQQQRAGRHWQSAIDYVHSGKLGKISKAYAWKWRMNTPPLPVKPDGQPPAYADYDMWLGPAPDRPFNENRFHYDFRWFWDYAGGLMTDWGVHLIDMVLYGMKARGPKSVSSTGGKFIHPQDARQTPDTQTAVYEFDDFMMTWEHTMNIADPPFEREHGIAFWGENGTLVANRGGWEVRPKETRQEDGGRQYVLEAMPFQPRQANPRKDFVKNFMDCVKSRQEPLCPIEEGANVAIVSHLGNISHRLGRKVHWDKANQQFINDSEAASLGRANYRKKWELPRI